MNLSAFYKTKIANSLRMVGVHFSYTLIRPEKAKKKGENQELGAGLNKIYSNHYYETRSMGQLRKYTAHFSLATQFFSYFLSSDRNMCIVYGMESIQNRMIICCHKVNSSK